MIKQFQAIGDYFMLLKETFRKPQKMTVFWRMYMREVRDLAINSFGLVVFISAFIGAVTAIQMFNNFDASPFPIPTTFVGYATKAVLVLEFCPTIISLVLAGKVGSYIASSLGSMKVSEQIDAMNIMGVNSASLLIMPKILACILFNPLLIMVSFVIGTLGGYAAGMVTGSWTVTQFTVGIQMYMPNLFFTYALIKTIVFAFLIATIPSYFGYKVEGGSLEVGRASTKAVVWTMIFIIISELLLTQMILS